MEQEKETASPQDDGGPSAPQEGEPPGHFGPGLRAPRGVDPTLVTAWVFTILGLTPYGWWEILLGFGFFGPIEVPAILAMVGVLFGFIAVLRGMDLEDARLRLWAGIALGLGLVRLFLFPFF